jgi:6-pyruvoyltetrahydropterin/6-carboxytetrahydropterin synthase
MKVVEKFISVDGEGPTAGGLSVFIRLAGCNLRCVWCDTCYAQDYNSHTEELHKECHKRGMVEDFSIIKPVLREIEEYFDHKLVIEDNERGREVAASLCGFEIRFVPYRPTVEEMSRHIYNMLRDKGLPIMEVELFETPTNSCIYKE